MSTSLRILIVEDHPTTVMAMREELEKIGHIVCGEASDYASAVDLMEQEWPDLAIVDIGLRGRPDGIVTAQELIRIKPIPLLYLTAHKDHETFLRAKQTNPVSFLHKPLQYWQLRTQVDLAWHNYHQVLNHDDRSKAEPVRTKENVYLPDSYEEDLGDLKKRVNSRFRVRIESIIWLQARGSYAKLFVTQEELGRLKKRDNPLLVTLSLGSVLDYLPDTFYRVSQSIAVNLNHVDRIESSHVIMEGYSKEIDLPEGEQRKMLRHLNVARSRQRR